MFKETIQPGFSDTDALGHISNTCHPVWFENARTPVFQILHPSLDLKTWPLIIARIEVDYLAQTHWGSPVEIRTWIKKLGNSSCHVAQEAWQNGQRVAAGTAIMIYYDYANAKAMTIPDDMRDELAKHQIDDEQ